MSNRTTLIVAIVLCLVMLLGGLLVFNQMPGQSIIHWNAAGQPDGYSSKAFAIFFMPFFTLGLSLLLYFVPMIDPLKANIQAFRREYNLVILGMVIFMAYVHLLTILQNLGLPFSLPALMMPGMGILFYLLGVVLGKAKRNFFIGIRTPWTLSSDTVWAKTHRLGGIVFRIMGGLIALMGLLPPVYMSLTMVPILGGALGLVVYSYFVWRQEQHSENNKI